MALLIEWISNESPRWAVIWTFIDRQSLVLHKIPGIRPLGCGKTWQRFFVKVILSVTILKAKLECGVDQLGEGLCVEIDSGFHTMPRIRNTLKSEEETIFLLIDAHNTFNEANRTKILLTV